MNIGALAMAVGLFVVLALMPPSGSRLFPYWCAAAIFALIVFAATIAGVIAIEIAHRKEMRELQTTSSKGESQ